MHYKPLAIIMACMASAAVVGYVGFEEKSDTLPIACCNASAVAFSTKAPAERWIRIYVFQMKWGDLHTSAMTQDRRAFVVTFENHPPPTSKHSPVCLLLSWTSIVTIGATWAGSSKLRISGDKRFSVIFDFATGTTQFTKTLFFS